MLGRVLAENARSGNSPLFRLSLRHNRFIGDRGAIALAALVEDSKMLTDLNLSVNRIGDKGAAAIAQSLASNAVMTKLDLSGNAIRDNGAIAISSAIKKNSVLRRLALHSNNIGVRGMEAVKRAISFDNTTLHTVSLEGNNEIADGTGGAARLVAAFQRGDQIRSEPRISNETFVRLTRMRADAANAIPISAAERHRTSKALETAESLAETTHGQPRYKWEEGLTETFHKGWSGKRRSASGLGRPLFWKAPDDDEDWRHEPDEFGK
jgi:hypothetical protein